MNLKTVTGCVRRGVAGLLSGSDEGRPSGRTGFLSASLAVLAGGHGSAALFGVVAAAALSGGASAQPLPPVPVPPENPITESKRVLGKILFWDEQFSFDNTMACGTCHIPGRGGTDPRIAVNPGLDGLSPSPDDKQASPGVVFQDAEGMYEAVDFFSLRPQVTPRRANPSILAMYAPELFWDGRASSEFIDPQTGVTVIAAGGALESQAVGPVVSEVEMAHANRDWDEIVAKLTTAAPMTLASDLPADMHSAVDGADGYPALFAEAFGDEAITAARIAMAIATYERTLVPDQTPWDAFIAGDPNALTPQQAAGWNAFNNSRCSICHLPPLFTNNTFINIGLRPVEEDIGRQEVTGRFGDRGRFKVPTLRNVGLEARYMHTGQFGNLGQVFAFYADVGGQQFDDNKAPVLDNPINFPPNARNNIINFLTNGLTDPRVAGEAFPFDRPTLFSESSPRNPELLGGGVVGSGGFVPAMVANMPPLIGDDGFKVGIDLGLAGAVAWLAVSEDAPIAGEVDRTKLLGPVTLGGLLAGEGYGTMPWAIPLDASLDGRTFFMQWIVEDAGAPGGEALSRIAAVTLLCGNGGCADAPCLADLTGDGVLDFFDVAAFLQMISVGDPAADFDGDGVISFFDIQAFLQAFSDGCP
jgi:cytochrome c peroxidase